MLRLWEDHIFNKASSIGGLGPAYNKENKTFYVLKFDFLSRSTCLLVSGWFWKVVVFGIITIFLQSTILWRTNIKLWGWILLTLLAFSESLHEFDWRNSWSVVKGSSSSSYISISYAARINSLLSIKCPVNAHHQETGNTQENVKEESTK